MGGEGGFSTMSSQQRNVVLSCNMKGLLPHKAVYMRGFFVQKGTEIFCAQETHGSQGLIPRLISSLGMKGGCMSLYQRQARGVGIFWSKRWELLKSVKDREGRIVGSALKRDDGYVLGVLSVYAPNLDGTVEKSTEYVNFLISLKHYVEELGSSPQGLIIAGDFNLVMSKSLDSLNGAKIHRVPRDEVATMMEDHDLYDCFRTFNPGKKSYTFAPLGANPHGTFNRLDYVWANESVLSKHDDCVHVTVPNTDHKAVVLRVGAKRSNKPGLWRHDNALNSNAEFLQGIPKVIDDAMSEGCGDARSLFEWVKFKIKRYSAGMSKEIKNNRFKERLQLLKVADMDIQSEEDMIKVRTAKTALDKLERERAEGVIRASSQVRGGR